MSWAPFTTICIVEEISQKSPVYLPKSVGGLLRAKNLYKRHESTNLFAPLKQVKISESGSIMGFHRFTKKLFNRTKPKRNISSSADKRVPKISVSNAESLLPSKKELEIVFKTFDINGDGKISWSEVGEVMSYFGGKSTEEELRLMVKAGDINGDGLLDFSEFVDLNTKDVDLDWSLRDMEKAFDLFDLDGNGSISADELQRFFRNLGENYSLDECQKMINGVDCDGNGSINFQEFMTMMIQPESVGE